MSQDYMPDVCSGVYSALDAWLAYAFDLQQAPNLAFFHLSCLFKHHANGIFFVLSALGWYVY